MKIGIVGNEAAKFTLAQKSVAIQLIESLISRCDTVVSGRCHLGGVDIWAEQVADSIGAAKQIYPPKSHSWQYGYKPRNILIAQNSDIVHVIVVERLPAGFAGMRFPACYHCLTARPPHVKSGACWTAKYAESLGKQALWHILP